MSKHKCKECAWIYEQEQKSKTTFTKAPPKEDSPMETLKLHVKALNFLIEDAQPGDKVWDHAFRLTTQKIDNLRKKILKED
jgi:hypothetical protein